MVYNISLDKEAKTASIKAEQVYIDASTLMKEVFPIVEDYAMSFTDGTIINTTGYNNNANTSDKRGNTFILCFRPDDINMSLEAFIDIANIVNKKVSQQVRSLNLPPN